MRCQALARILLGIGVLTGLSGPAMAQASPPAGGTCEVIHAIEVRGNEKMSADAVRFDLRVRPGDRWDEQRLRSEFRRFWNRGYFSDLRFLRRCEPEGAVLVVEIEERPTIISIDYQKNKVVNQQQIEDYFRERDFTLTIGTPLDRKRLWRAETLIEELLGQKGFLDAQVEAAVSERLGSTRAVTFRVDPGGKTRIRKLEFVGNDAFSDRRLRKQLELTRPWRWFWPFGRKSLYHPLKYQQDINNVLQYYRDYGYLDADVRPPIVDVRASEPEDQAKAEERARRKAEKAARKAERKREKEARRRERAGEPPLAEEPPEEPPVRPKQKKWVYITVPVDEGPVYRLGEVQIEGNEVFEDELLRALVPLPQGAVLADSLIEVGLEGIRRAYGRRGYVYAAVTRRFEKREGEPVADVIIDVDEDQAYSVRRIEFAGNTDTQDEVLRREMNVHEGELLDKAALDRSMLKLQQLGYWVPSGDPTLEPVPEQPEVDVIVQGEEQARNEIQAGGGYSELEGGFFMARYFTRNFLGRGESLSLQAAVGGRASRASLAFTEPWFLGRPWTFGFQIFRQSFDFGRVPDITGDLRNLEQTATGGSLTIGRRLGDFAQLQMTYRYENIEADTLARSTATFTTTSTRLATLSPIFSYKRVNNYLRPTRGIDILVLPQLAWDALGGENNFFRPRLEGSFYHPVPFARRLFIAAHGEVGWIEPFGDIRREAGLIGGVPVFQRFYLGGDAAGPRVFETRTITPYVFRARVDREGNPLPVGSELVFLQPVGGSKMALAQFELGLPIGRTATFAAFFDVGGTYAEGVDINLDDARMSAGIEFRVFLPVFQAPIRLIYGWPIQSEDFDRTSRFQFSLGLPF
jgi:outer membrane protein insertion porin family